MSNSTNKLSSAKSGMLWSFMIQGGIQIINFVVTIILARLLLPEQFGLIGMISIVIAISKVLVDGGFGSSLIRNKDADDIDYSTVFFVNLFTSFVLYGVLFFIAPLLASFYQQEILTNLVRTLGVVIIINAFSLVQSTKLNKELQFKTQFKLAIPSLIISAVVSILMAYNGYGVWSLVAKDIIFASLASLQLWWYAKWVPRWIFNKERLKYHFNFGYKLSLNQIINTTFENLYSIIIGKYFSPAQLGYFTRARSLEQIPSGFFFNAFNRVFYPLLAHVSDNDIQLKNTYSRLMQIVVFSVTPLLIYLGIIATPFFSWLLTDKWLPAVPFFQLLVISGIFYPIHQYNLNICNLKGRSDMVLKLSMSKNILLLFGAFTAYWFGIYGLLFSLIFVNILMTVINAFYSGKLIGYDLKEQSKDLLPILMVNAVLAISFYWMQITFFCKIPHIWNLIFVAVCFFFVYFIVAYICKLKVISYVLILIKKNNKYDS